MRAPNIYAAGHRRRQHEHRAGRIRPRHESARRRGHNHACALQRLVAQWRVSTIWNHTVDEYGVLFRSLFAMDDLDASGIHGIIISSVVPPLDSTLRQVCEHYFKLKPLFVEPGVKTGMPVPLRKSFRGGRRSHRERGCGF